ncbi:MAG TPA: type II toxin-antitoxin system RelE/ParE family toxin [Thermoanaerobaculia bacterium]|nr:type II toxin-antitoxin system RelE/ParE family toxin [Thermoanaerobaculia bacterium]
MRLIYHPDAEHEVIEAARFYEQRMTGLGERFLEEFDAAIAEVRGAPERWPEIEHHVRRYVMSRFPYGIFYRCDGQHLRILVVKHHSRHPDYWRYRLESSPESGT